MVWVRASIGRNVRIKPENQLRLLDIAEAQNIGCLSTYVPVQFSKLDVFLFGHCFPGWPVFSGLVRGCQWTMEPMKTVATNKDKPLNPDSVRSVRIRMQHMIDQPHVYIGINQDGHRKPHEVEKEGNYQGGSCSWTSTVHHGDARFSFVRGIFNGPASLKYNGVVPAISAPRASLPPSPFWWRGPAFSTVFKGHVPRGLNFVDKNAKHNKAQHQGQGAFPKDRISGENRLMEPGEKSKYNAICRNKNPHATGFFVFHR